MVGNDAHYYVECGDDYRVFICTALVLISLASKQERDSLLVILYVTHLQYGYPNPMQNELVKNFRLRRSNIRLFTWGVTMTVCWNKTFQFRQRILPIPLPKVIFPDPLGGLKSVPGNVFGHAESIGTFFINIFWESKIRNFFLGGVGGIGSKMTKF